MCGVVGTVSHSPVNQLLYDALLLLQHRGQDAAGIATMNGNSFTMHKANGLVRDVFRTRNMRSLVGNAGIGQVRYPTAGSASSEEEAQPFYVSAPYGIILAHNGNLTNAASLRVEMAYRDRRHINTSSDTEVLLNVLADELQKETNSAALDEGAMFNAVTQVTKRVKGSYAVVSLIAGYGLLAFRDPFGIRPLCIGRMDTPKGPEWMIASESVALDGLGVDLFNVGQYRYRISNLNYGLPGCRALVCFGRKIAWALGLVCINSVDFEFFSDRFVPEVFA